MPEPFTATCFGIIAVCSLVSTIMQYMNSVSDPAEKLKWLTVNSNDEMYDYCLTLINNAEDCFQGWEIDGVFSDGFFIIVINKKSMKCLCRVSPKKSITFMFESNSNRKIMRKALNNSKRIINAKCISL